MRLAGERMPHRWCVWAVAVAVSLAASCDSQASTGVTTVPVSMTPVSTLPSIASPATEPVGSSVAVELAPSQIAASTVAAPALPGPCNVVDLELVHRPADVDAESSSGTIEFTNVGDDECEIDLTGTVHLSPQAEPSVWLAPDTMAQISVQSVGDDCTDRARALTLLIATTEVVVDISENPVCEYVLDEFFSL